MNMKDRHLLLLILGLLLGHIAFGQTNERSVSNEGMKKADQEEITYEIMFPNEDPTEIGLIYFFNGLGANFYVDTSLWLGDHLYSIGAFYEGYAEHDFLLPWASDTQYENVGLNLGRSFNRSGNTTVYVSPGYSLSEKELSLGAGIKHKVFNWLGVNLRASNLTDDPTYGLGVGIRF